jgi:hypothetical protein
MGNQRSESGVALLDREPRLIFLSYRKDRAAVKR